MAQKQFRNTQAPPPNTEPPQGCQIEHFAPSRLRLAAAVRPVLTLFLPEPGVGKDAEVVEIDNPISIKVFRQKRIAAEPFAQQ